MCRLRRFASRPPDEKRRRCSHLCLKRLADFSKPPFFAPVFPFFLSFFLFFRFIFAYSFQIPLSGRAPSVILFFVYKNSKGKAGRPHGSISPLPGGLRTAQTLLRLDCRARLRPDDGHEHRPVCQLQRHLYQTRLRRPQPVARRLHAVCFDRLLSRHVHAGDLRRPLPQTSHAALLPRVDVHHLRLCAGLLLLHQDLALLCVCRHLRFVLHARDGADHRIAHQQLVCRQKGACHGFGLFGLGRHRRRDDAHFVGRCLGFRLALGISSAGGLRFCASLCLRLCAAARKARRHGA